VFGEVLMEAAFRACIEEELRHLTRTSIAAELAGPPAGLDRLPGAHDLDVEGNRVRR
jgi:hypothetical protein